MDKLRNVLTSKAVVIAVIVALVVGLGSWLVSYVVGERERQEQQRWVQEYRDGKLAAYAEEDGQYDDYEVDVAFLGDSLTDGYPLERYYPQYVTANRGIGGDTTFSLMERLEPSVYGLKPKVAVLLIGGNNLETMFENYEDILRKLRDALPETKLVLLSLTAMGGDYAQKNPLAALNNVKIRLLSERYGCEYVDIFTPLFDLSTGELYTGYRADDVHLNEAGYQVVTEALTPVLEKLLEEKGW